MNFSVNQNRQFYVVKAKKTSVAGLTTVGDFYPVAPTTDYLKDCIWGHYLGASGEIIRTDLIKKKCILSGSLAGPKDDALQLPTYTLTVLDSTEVSTENTYYVRITLRDYYGSGDDTTYIKTVSYKPTEATVANLTHGIAEAISDGFAREYEKPFTIAESTTGSSTTAAHVVTLTTQLSFSLGKSNLIPPTAIIATFDGDGDQWGTFVESYTEAPTKNSTRLAQLEYFCMGERGDQYRKVGFPYEIESKCLVDATSTSGYFVLDIHYAYIGDGMENQASEKTMTIVTPTAAVMKAVLDVWGIDDKTEWLRVSSTTGVSSAISAGS